MRSQNNFIALLTRVLSNEQHVNYQSSYRMLMEQHYEGFTQKVKQYNSPARRQNFICSQSFRLVQYANDLYREWRFNKYPVHGRLLILTLQLAARIHAGSMPYCRKVPFPRMLGDRYRKIYQNAGSRLRSRFRAYAIDEVLIDLTLQPLVVDLGNRDLPYNTALYLKYYIENLLGIEFGLLSGSLANRHLCIHLMRLNFNHPGFVSYMENRYRCNIQVLSIPEKVRFLNTEKRFLDGLPDHPVCYSGAFKSIRASMLLMVIAEMARWKAKRERV